MLPSRYLNTSKKILLKNTSKKTNHFLPYFIFFYLQQQMCLNKYLSKKTLLYVHKPGSIKKPGKRLPGLCFFNYRKTFIVKFSKKQYP
ncbi:hypothetical protein C0V77_02145 [Emticicia sp. TH156]|nr:hypothetical protein C0V77_02145 [Emticicia sp. TH156]